MRAAVSPFVIEPRLDRAGETLHLRRGVQNEIRSGVYPPGSRLPPQRQLATELGINVSTVSRAYKELQLRGLVIGSKRRGSLVTGGAMPSVEPAQPASNAAIDLTVNRPATSEFLNCLARTLAELPRDPRDPQLQEYQPPQGPSWARAAGVQWMAAPDFAPSPEHVVVTSGAQHGLYAVLNSLIGTDGVILADQLTYYGLKALAPAFQCADDFAANAKARGVVVMPSSAFAVDRSEIEHGVRINLACATSRDQLVSALRLLTGTLKDRPRALFGTI